jgi:RNA recognition motif-containing protein
MFMLRLFVGNIPHACDEIELRKWFERHGHEVAFAQVIRDRMTGHSRGFGFVELQDTSDLRGTVEQLNGQRLSGRVLTVNAATPRIPGGKRRLIREIAPSQTKTSVWFGPGFLFYYRIRALLCLEKGGRMSKAQPARASPDIMEQRKREAEARAAKKGHRLGNWRIRKDEGRDTWHGPCLNQSCRASVALNPTKNHGIMGVTAFDADCPYAW